MNTSISKIDINNRGNVVTRDCLTIDKQQFVISGQYLKTAALVDEWREDITNPQQLLSVFRDSQATIDLFTFWQRISDPKPKFEYYKESVYIAAIPIASYSNWWENQINAKTRNMIRKSDKKGVLISQAELNDRLVNGVVGIFNESPVRRGKPFWHYGKDFDTTKTELSSDLDRSIFITAYFGEELIGFIKILRTDKFAMITMILDLFKHRDKSPINGLIAKAVEICEHLQFPFLTYTIWRRGDHGAFQKRNGFEKIAVPRYFIPLTLKGRLALKFNLHNGIKNAIPNPLYDKLLRARAGTVSVIQKKKAS